LVCFFSDFGVAMDFLNGGGRWLPDCFIVPPRVLDKTRARRVATFSFSRPPLKVV
jgi:hypothetical protein